MRFRTFLGKGYRWLKREPLKRFKTFRYKTWLSLKQISFKNRDEKIRIVEEVLRKNPNVYFTTDLVKTGFTDQLIGFNFLYKTGRGVGLKYYHTQLSAHRSSDPFLFDPITQSEENQSSEKRSKVFDDIFDFLGINKYLMDQSDTGTLPRKEIPLDLNIMLYGREGIDSYESLLEEMKVVLYPFLYKNKKVVFSLKAEPRTYFTYYRYVVDQKEHEIDYISCFENNGNRWESEFEPDSTNIMVHIRQGDTGTIETPWNTFIPVWHETDGKFTQFKNDREIPGHKRIYPNDFYQFLKDFKEALTNKKSSTVVFSDGYKKAFRWIYLYYKEKDISEDEIEKLKKLEPEYDNQQFGKFRDLQDTETVIGEEIDKLYSLVRSFFDADVLVAGTQATMIPKMMASYGKKDRMPFLILLYHTQKPSLEYIGFNESSPFLTLVDIENYNTTEIAERASTYLKSQRKFDI